jgi:hypothetical protein
MIRKSVVTAMVLAASVFATGAVYAAPTSVHSPVHGMFSNQKLISFNLHNATSEPLKVKAGDKEMTLAAGSVTSIKLAAGTKIVASEGSSKYEAGSVLATVSSELKDATVTLN